MVTMPIPLRRVATTTLLALFATAALMAQGAPLRYRWAAGDTAKYRLTQETNAVVSGVPGIGEMTVTTSIEQLHTTTATAVAADGAATLQIKYDAVKLDMRTPMGQTVFDSASAAPPSDPLGQQLAPMLAAIVGESLTLVIEPDGAVRSLTGANKIKEKMTAAMPNAGGAMTLGPTGGVDAMFGDEAMKGALGQSLATLPKAAVKTGDSWTTETKLPGPAGEMLVANVFTLKSFETIDGREIARIGVVQQIRPNGNATPTGPMATKMEPGTGDGELLFDVKLGRVVRSSNNASLPMAMVMTMPDGQTMALTANTKTKVIYEMVK